MNLPNETMCVLPWVSVEISPIGSMRPCCLADIELVDENNEKYEAKTASIDGVRNCKQMQDLRIEMLRGDKPVMCRRCWAEEDSGRTSKRMNTIKRLNKMIDHNAQWGNDANELMFLDLKLGNICNIKCRICGSWSSSSFASEELKFIPKEHKKTDFAYTMLKKGAWPRDTHTFWDELYDHSLGLQYLEFTGGEPFMIQEHFDYLEYLVNLDVARNIEIHYNTNGTQWPEEHTHLWSHFKHVEIAFSIDNVGKRFEYERSGASWFEVNDNINKFMALRDNSDNISLQLCTTINIFNVLYLKDIVAWKFYDKFDFVFWNMLHDSPEWCITSLPQIAKRAVAQQLKHSLVLDDEIQEEFNNIVDFMRHDSKVTLYELMIKIKCLDEKRGEHLRDTHPELWKLLSEETFEEA